MSTAEQHLRQLLDDPVVVLPETSGERPGHGIAKVRYTHDAMIDLIIENPAISQNEIARIFGYSASWVSMIMTSDAFKAKLALRSEQLIDPGLRMSIKERFEGMILRSMEILAEKLDKPAVEVPDQLALKALEIATKAAGYGAKSEGPKTVVNMDIHLHEMGERMTKLLQRKRGVIEGEAKVIADLPQET